MMQKKGNCYRMAFKSEPENLNSLKRIQLKFPALLVIFLTACNVLTSEPERTQPSPAPPTSTQPIPTPTEPILAAAPMTDSPAVDSEVLIPTLEPGAPCPVTPVQEDFWPGVGGPAAGEYPIWISSRGQTKFSNLGPKVLPPASGELQFVEGHLVKTHVFVDQTVEGDLRVTGRQLDGDSLVYFNRHGLLTHIDEETLQMLGMPADFAIVENAHNPTQFPTPPGKVQSGIGPIYVNPGCYQLTATIAEFTVSIVLEILDG